MTQATHINYLKQALALAQKRKGSCAPNPAVGAIIVKNNQIIAMGYHLGAGKAHAETEALKQLSLEDSVDAVMYVTLEPCCHYGRTPPCTELLIKHRIKTVYYGLTDPNPLVSGQGASQLKQAGIECVKLALPEIKAFYESYLYWTDNTLPWVTAKLALSLDGKIAGEGGERITITGREAQAFTHQWRKQSDAILTTVKTVIQDDPQLNVRLGNEIYKKPLYILDRNLDFPRSAKLLNTSEKITLFHAKNIIDKKKNELESLGINCMPIDLKNGMIDPVIVLSHIGGEGVHDLLLETGGVCFESFALANRIHRAFVYVALKWLGTKAYPAFQRDTSIFTHAKNLQWHVLGDDVVCEFKFDSKFPPDFDKPSA